MPSQATITGTRGPGVAVTAQVFTKVIRFELDCEQEILTLFFSEGRPPIMINVSTATTWTLTVSGNTYTLTVS